MHFLVISVKDPTLTNYTFQYVHNLQFFALHFHKQVPFIFLNRVQSPVLALSIYLIVKDIFLLDLYFHKLWFPFRQLVIKVRFSPLLKRSDVFDFLIVK